MVSYHAMVVVQRKYFSFAIKKAGLTLPKLKVGDVTNIPK